MKKFQEMTDVKQQGKNLKIAVELYNFKLLKKSNLTK